MLWLLVVDLICEIRDLPTPRKLSVTVEFAISEYILNRSILFQILDYSQAWGLIQAEPLVEHLFLVQYTEAVAFTYCKKALAFV
jgi:hypothetical protein